MKMNKTLEKKITFKDPIHGSITIEHEVIKSLISSREFQRLRRIRQLGFTYTVFHTATHDRFSHSLGAYEIARRLVYNNENFNILNDDEKLYVCIAALLHDLGHGPFSHTFETAFEFNHEEMTGLLITSPTTSVNAILKDVSEELPGIIATILAKKHPNKLLSNIITSDVDVDRMDYLIRDSYFTSTSLGVYDHFQLTRHMEIHENEIVINEKAINSLESFFIARHHMFKQVYTHLVAESFEVQSKWFFERMQKLHLEKYNFSFNYDILKPFMEKNYSPEEFLRIDDYDIFNIWKLAAFDKDNILSKCANNLINRKKCGFLYGNQSELEKTFQGLKTISSRTNQLNTTFSVVNIKVKLKDGTLVDATSASPILKGLISTEMVDNSVVTYYI